MASLILRVAVPSPLYRLFDYLPPTDCDPTRLQPGIRLRVPFGKREAVGILLATSTETDQAPARLRPVLAVLDAEPLLPADLLTLLHWAHAYYQYPPGSALAAALPVLLRQGQSTTPPAPVPSLHYWITAAGRAVLADATRLRRAPVQRRALEALARQPNGLDAASLQALARPALWRGLAAQGWISHHPTAPEGLSSSSSGDVADQSPADDEGDSTPPVVPPLSVPPPLNCAQAAAVAAVTAGLERFQVFLLEGVTGSGKTEVYLRLIETVLAQDRQALLLTPEIGLTPQLLERLQARFPEPLAVLHSGLSNRERLHAWRLAREGTARIVVGTRSAVFAPLRAPGLLIVDEEHDPSYKQQDGFRYQARDLAIRRAQQWQIPVVLGSATPALESIRNVQTGRYQRLSLPERVGGGTEPPIHILDLRGQVMRGGLAQPLLEAIAQCLDRQEQVLLFLNRRGYAPVLLCHACGWLSQCLHCDARMTLHLRQQRLCCHHCGAVRPVEITCPVCGAADLRPTGQGTEQLEAVLSDCFPEVGIARLDRDSTRRRGSLQQLLGGIQRGERRILIGTQMLAKGHHFPEVTLAAIVDADQGLHGVDFRASERMAQLILQVAGRAGRADKPGRVVLQTHHPDHPLLRVLAAQGYPAFATAALAERQAGLLPPFAHQALLRAEAASPQQALQFLTLAKSVAEPLAEAVELLGPAPAPMERRAGRYRAHLLFQAPQRSILHRFLDQWRHHMSQHLRDRQVRWSLDVDPVTLD